MDFYPGDNYVDWIGVSVFGQIMGSNASNIYYVAEKTKELHKPLMIAESTPYGVQTIYGAYSWSEWFWPIFNFIEKYDVKMFSYINSDWEELPMFQGQGWGNARIEADSYVQGKWLQRMSNSVYMHASTNLFQLLGYSP
ncbi:MAG TPA: hypothetical protein DCZ95_09220 [Verrucomicrobia bacterium]|nr:hypothetical protein [Verrucomicrobiota bacterium]